MEIDRREDQQVVEGPAQNFTGKVTLRAAFVREEPSRVAGAIVTFEAGARTNWHTHPLGQTLIVTDGVGWTQVEGEEKIEFQEGDVMWCPRDKRHWHGATPHGPMTHIAIQERLNGSNVTWMEPVTDEQYLAGSCAGNALRATVQIGGVKPNIDLSGQGSGWRMSPSRNDTVSRPCLSKPVPTTRGEPSNPRLSR